MRLERGLFSQREETKTQVGCFVRTPKDLGVPALVSVVVSGEMNTNTAAAVFLIMAFSNVTGITGDLGCKAKEVIGGRIHKMTLRKKRVGRDRI